MNVPRQNKAVATDTVFADVPAVDNGCKAAQLFVGRESLVIDAYPVEVRKYYGRQTDSENTIAFIGDSKMPMQRSLFVVNLRH